MKAKLRAILLVITFISFSAAARQLAIDTPASSAPPDKERFSYAMGMNLGLQRKNSNSDTDVDSFVQALKDVLKGNPTQIKESEMPQILFEARRKAGNAPGPDKKKLAYAIGMRTAIQLKHTQMDLDADQIALGINDVLQDKPTKIQESEVQPILAQGKKYAFLRQSEKNKAEGKAFLEKNTAEKGVTVLPDGLQYRVLVEGNGKIPAPGDFVVISYRGKTIAGDDVERRNHVAVKAASPLKGFKEALQMMKVGSKWELFVPPSLAYGTNGFPMLQIGPESTLVYELELNDITTAEQAREMSKSRMGHGASQGFPTENTPAVVGQTNAPDNKTPVAE